MAADINLADVLRLDMLAEQLNLAAKQTYLWEPALLDDLAFALSTAYAVVEVLPKVELTEIEALLSKFKTDVDNLVVVPGTIGGSGPPRCPDGFSEEGNRCVPDP